MSKSGDFKLAMNLDEWQVRELRLELIDVVRSDKVVGKGTCTTVDECMNDRELISDFVEFIIDQADRKQVDKYVRYLRQCEKLRREREGDICNA